MNPGFIHAARLYAVLDLVAAERARQNALIQEGRIPFDCADPSLDPSTKFPVLVEEVGEVAKELQELAAAIAKPISEAQLDECEDALARLRTELIQVAAVAVAIAESLGDALAEDVRAPEARA